MGADLALRTWAAMTQGSARATRSKSVWVKRRPSLAFIRPFLARQSWTAQYLLRPERQ
jgi:hypothetical protein